MDFYARRHIIGGKGGQPFEAYDVDGRVIEKIGVWAGGWQIKAIRLWRSRQGARTFGKPGGSYAEYTFKPAERIERLSLWGNGAGTRLGWIEFTTSNGGRFSHGMTDWGRKQEYPIDVGSGICVGMMGRAYDDVDAAAFVFLGGVRSMVMKDVRYPTLETDTIGIAPVTVDSFSDNVPGDWNFSGSKQVMVSESWTFTAGVEVHADVTVQAGVPMVAEFGGSFGWSVSATATYDQTNTRADTLSWTKSGTLAPGHTVKLRAVTREGKLRQLPYEGRVEVTMDNGAVFSYQIAHSYAGVSYTSVDIVDANTGLALGVDPDPAPPRVESPTVVELEVLGDEESLDA